MISTLASMTPKTSRSNSRTAREAPAPEDDAARAAEDPNIVLDLRRDASQLTLRQKVWFTFEEPNFSALARTVSIAILGVIILSVVGFLAGSFKGCRWTSAPDTNPDGSPQLDSEVLRRECAESTPAEPWNTIELVCILIFTVEYFVRLVAAGTLEPGPRCARVQLDETLTSARLHRARRRQAP